MGNKRKTADVVTIDVVLKDVIDALCDAARLGDAKANRIADEVFVESPQGIDLGELGNYIIKKLESLPKDDPERKYADIPMMKKGIEYIRSGYVSITSRQLGSEPVVKGEYTVRLLSLH